MIQKTPEENYLEFKDYIQDALQLKVFFSYKRDSKGRFIKC